MQERVRVMRTFNDFCDEEYENVLTMVQDWVGQFSKIAELNVAFGFKMLQTFLIQNYAKIRNAEIADGLIFDYVTEMQNHDLLERQFDSFNYNNKFYCAWVVVNEFVEYFYQKEAEQRSVNDLRDRLIDEDEYDEKEGKITKNW